ncbi:MAG TPA: SIR2 family protein [Thermoanaerobaculia bacterium]|nr:SIR2 family protein [Thermoanaerobaculia bacterium]
MAANEPGHAIPDIEWDMLVERVMDSMCVPFLGAGASLGAGIPSSGDLAEELARKCSYPGTDKRDFLRVCQYYTMVTDPAAPRHAIIRRLTAPGLQPGVVHNTLAAMPFPYVLTTNFDSLMERAYHAAGKIPSVSMYRVGGDQAEVDTPTVRRPLVYKLHGSVEDPRSMVCTEDDTVEFMASLLLGEPPLPQSIKNLFRQFSVVFIGYGLKDWNIRVLLRALRGKSAPISCFAVQQRPTNDLGLAQEWDQMVVHLRRGELRCYDMDAVEFVTELSRRYRVRVETERAAGVAV